MAVQTATTVDMRRRVARNVLRVTSPSRTRIGWWDASELAIATFGFLAYFLVRGGVVTRTGDALAHARRIVDLELALGVFIEPSIQRWVLASEVLLRLMNFVYFWLDFPLIIAVGLVLFVRRRNEYTLLRDMLLVSGSMALVIYYMFPVAPPRFLPEWGFVDTLALFSHLSYQAQSMAPFVNPFAAVPSLHVGWSLLLVIAVFRATGNGFARGGAIAVLVLQSVAVVATGNHFLFDGVIGLILCAGAVPPTFWLHRTVYPAIRKQLAEWARPEPRGARPVAPPGQRFRTRSLADR